MKHCMHPLITAVVLALPVQAAGEPKVYLEVLRLTDPAPSADLADPYTAIELAIEHPGISGLAESARVTRASDDTGKDLMAGAGPFDRNFEEEGYFMRHQITHNPEKGWIRVPLILPGLPHPDATRLEIGMDLDIDVMDDGTRSVLIEDVDFSEVPGWGVEVDVEGARMTCRDERRERPEDEPLELVCAMREGSLTGVEALTGGAAPEPADPRANLVIAGPRDAVDLEVTLPQTRVEAMPVTLRFGLGLQGRGD